MNDGLNLHSMIPATKVIAKVRERYYEGQKGPESLECLLKHLSTTTKCKLFDVMSEYLQQVPISSSIMTVAADDGGETTVSIDEEEKIIDVQDIELPTLRRFSMMFYPYIFEVTKVVYYKSRIGMKYEQDQNWLVLPYFVTLYAICNSQELFDTKVISAAKSLYIANLYSALYEGSASIRSEIKVLLGLEKDTNPLADIIGITKAITLYEMAKNNNSFDTILQAVLDSSQSIGKELDYNVLELDINGENVKECCRKFVQENVDCLRNIDEPDEYQPPKFNF